MDSQTGFQHEVPVNGHVFWNEEMDRIMLDTLREQLHAGMKGQGGWKSAAFTAVATSVTNSCHMQITSTHDRNRLKTWKKMISGVQELLGLSGFGWDDERKTVTAEESVWADALRSRRNLRYLKGKSIERYTDLIEVIREDQANGARKTTAGMADEEMAAADQQDDVELGDDLTQAEDVENPTPPPPQRRRSRSAVGGIREEMSEMRTMIGRIAGAMETRNKIDDPLWSAIRDAIYGVNELSVDAKIDAMEYFVGQLERRRMFLTLDANERHRWLIRKFRDEDYVPQQNYFY